MTLFTGGQYFLDGRRAARRIEPGADVTSDPVDGTSSAA
jgi:hypothetical protein